MTDRSSEERSRFEKWFEAKYKGLGFAGPYFELNEHGSYKESTVFSEFETWKAGWRAALEDRQEAAPIQEGLKDLSVRLLRRFAECQPPYDHDNECSFCGVKEGNQHWHTCSWLTARTIFGIGPGVPSEATPSKEKAPRLGGFCPKCHWFICQCQEAAPEKEGIRPRLRCDRCGLATAITIHGLCPTCDELSGVPSEATNGIPVKFADSAETREAWQALVDCGPEMHQPTDADLITRRVPSEATPSKEGFSKDEGLAYEAGKRAGRRSTLRECIDFINLPRFEGKFRRLIDGFEGMLHEDTEFAPAPEVQGTPTKSNVAHQPWCASAPRPMDVPMGRGPYPCDCGTVKASPAPVETPQKETPTMPYGAGAQNFGVKTYAETADQIRAATITGTDKFVNSAAPAPEGVQGKEPQTPQNLGWTALANMNHALHCLRLEVAESIVQDLSAKINTCINVAKTLGEAAGRRSAIALVKDWAKNGEGITDLYARLDELQEKPK